MSAEEFPVLIKVWLRPSDYRALHRLATANHTTIADVLASLGRRAVSGPLLDRVAALKAQGHKPAAIADRLGLPVARIYQLNRRLKTNGHTR